MERIFAKELFSLEKIFGFTREFVGHEAIDESSLFTIDFVLEELFTNMIKYNPSGGKDVMIKLAREGRKLLISLEDYSSRPFDVTKAKRVDIDQPLQDRKEGGLGIHLVQKLMDNVEYKYENGKSTITMTKYLEK